MKQLINELDCVALLSIGNNNTSNNFMTKYHENHTYENCRLIKINESFSNEAWREMLKKIGLDLLCVAAHYSTRYENSDNFIDNRSDEELKLYSYYLKNTNPTNIIDDFCSKYIAVGETECRMEWKSLHFVWKQFLSNSNLPNVIYSNTLKIMFKEKYSYDIETDLFIGITSKYLPVESNFIKFWENAITECDPNFDNELEVDELISLFKTWSNQTSEQLMSNGNITEENMLKILKHFFPAVEIIEDKFVLNVTCSLWNKSNDINDSIGYIKEQIKEEHKLALISFDDAYNYYNKYAITNSLKFVVSKRFFEKFLYYKLADHIVYEKFIETDWFTNS